MNAALTNGTREYQPQYSRHVSSPRRRRERYYALLARVRHRQLDLAMTGKVAESARYAHRASMLIQQIVIIDNVAEVIDSIDTSDVASKVHASEVHASEVHMDEPILECCGV